MQIIGKGNTTYILLSGIEVPSELELSDNVKLLPADTSHLNFETAIATCKRPDDIAVVAAFIPRITAQFKIDAPTSKELATLAWNSSWDAILLSAIFNTEVGFNLQSDTEASSISAQTYLHATNFHFHGLMQEAPYKLNKNEIDWISTHFKGAQQLLDNEKFQTAVHCLSSYPRSSAVHGSKIKGDLAQAVEESAELLKNLIHKCIENRDIPNEEDLAP